MLLMSRKDIGKVLSALFSKDYSTGRISQWMTASSPNALKLPV
jgi:hypothetical protein